MAAPAALGLCLIAAGRHAAPSSRRVFRVIVVGKAAAGFAAGAQARPRSDELRLVDDRDYANRFWRVLLATHDVLTRFRSGFLGKASPVHFFWGSFDLAVTRFSGRRAPVHPGGVPHLSDDVTREAYSHEVSSAGFWPGGGGPVNDAAFYSYAYPAPDGFASAIIRPDGAFFSKELGEFILPYEAMRAAPDPVRALMDFLQSTYEAAADLGRWDRSSLDCPPGEVGRPRLVVQTSII